MFRFTIRDLLWLMVVVGCLLGWGNDHEFQEKRFVKFRDDVSAGWAPGAATIETREQTSHEAVGRALGMKIPDDYQKWRNGGD